MNQDRRKLVAKLAADLNPIERPGTVGFAVLAWLFIASIYSVALIAAVGPMRPGALRSLVEYPTFAAETLLALAAVVVVAYAAARSSIPAAPASHARWAVVLLAAWAIVYVVGLRYPAHPVSTLGERPYCIWQTVAFSLPTFALMLWTARRQFPLRPVRTAVLAGAAAASIPAAIMQFACMYVPAHILTHHLGPILIMAAFGALAGPIALRRSAANRL
jgi:hypothetical protein